MQHVRPSPARPRVSDPAKLEFRWERFHKIAHELPPLFKRHWEEIALDREFVPLDPDWDSYYANDLRGVLHVLTVRAGDTLAGYVFNLVGGHLHYVGTRFAHTEMFWLDPAYRKGWAPVRMLQENIEGLRAREVEISTISFKLGFKNARVGKLLFRLGYEATDIVMRKVL
jgi:GNAT superfamily N-acetyltransferase